MVLVLWLCPPPFVDMVVVIFNEFLAFPLEVGDELRHITLLALLPAASELVVEISQKNVLIEAREHSLFSLSLFQRLLCVYSR